MIFAEFLIAFLFALVLSTLFVTVLNRSGPRTGFFWFFLLILLITWAGGIWIRPFGPSLRGVYWLPFLCAGSLAAFILSIIAPKPPPRGREDTLEMLDKIAQEEEFKKVAYISMNIFFAALIAGLIIAIILRYLLRG